MPDDLRTRIAAVLHSSVSVDYPTWDESLVLADAVIRELRLHVVTVGDFQTVIKGSYPKPLEVTE